MSSKILVVDINGVNYNSRVERERRRQETIVRGTQHK